MLRYLCLIYLFSLWTYISSLSVPSSLSTPYIFATCQAGAERLLKHEIAINHPEISPAYSRPGLITFKVQETASLNEAGLLDPLKSAFIQTNGISLNTATSIDEVIERAMRLKVDMNNQSFRLHVYQRDERGASSEHPLAVKAANQRVAEIIDQLLSHKLSDQLWLPINQCDLSGQQIDNRFVAADKETVFHVVVPTGKSINDPLFLGFHNHRAGLYSPFPGGDPQFILPNEAPSRAYLKIQEAFEYFNPNINPADVVVEIGSAPGGGSLAMLQKGLIVHGIDPSPADRQHAPIVAKHSNFRHIRSFVERIDRSQLPEKIDWIVCDANMQPDELIPSISRLARGMKSTLKGIFMTLKFNDSNWKKVSSLQDYLNQLSNIGLSEITAKQLSSNRQEVTAFGLTAFGKRSTQL